MKILLLGFSKIKFMPYATFYLDQIDCKHNEVHMVYWNRDMKDEDLSAYSGLTLHEFRMYMEDDIPKQQKLKFFWKYRKFVKQMLRNTRFDLIISLHTLPGLCVLDSLLSRYSKRYILDYRDSTFEGNRIFGGMVKLMAKKAKVVFVSSDAFRRFLPEEGVEIITSHNILADSLQHREARKENFVASDKIRISFWGLLRHYKHNLLIIDHIANDPRFELHYYGRAQKMGERMNDYLRENNISNVFLHGEYKPEERYVFAGRTEIIHNSYLDANTLLAMGNKYYDGLIFRIPQLCMPGSYMGERCIAKGTGCEIDPNDADFADQLYNYYTNIDWEKFNQCCDDDLNAILNEYYYGCEKIKLLTNSYHMSSDRLHF